MKRSPFELYIYAFEVILYKFIEYTNENAKKKYSININYNIHDIIKYNFVFYLYLFIIFMIYIQYGKQLVI